MSQLFALDVDAIAPCSIGAVLNDVPRGAAYGYYAYYSYYLPGYEAVEEREARQTAGPLVV